MICKKCETRVNSGTKCFQCGYDNSNGNNVPAAPVSSVPPAYKRSPVLIASMSLFIIVGIIIILSRIGFILRITPLTQITAVFPVVFRVSSLMYFVDIPVMPFTIRHMRSFITIAAAALDIALCILMLWKLNKRAFKAYVWLTTIGGFLQLVRWISFPTMIIGVLLPYLVKGLLLLIIHNLDGKHFGGGVFLFEPISAKLARKRKYDDTK